ncbi:hypothetical protein Ancab_037760 [Ancistrocladus abbreviatus]
MFTARPPYYSAIFTFIASMLLLLFLLILTLIFKIFTEKSINNPNYPPINGTVFHQLLYFDRLYDYQTEVARKHPTFRLLAPDQSEIFTADVRNVEHILRSSFDKYSKGKYNRDIVSDLFGEGIFAVNGEKWRQQRKLASFEFSTRVLRDFSCSVFRRSAVKLAGLVSEFAKANQVFDIHDMLMRCTLDSIFKVGFGVDLNCLEGSSKEGTQFMKAFDDANALVYRRFADPSWKLRRILNIGSEAALKKNIKVIDEFVHGVITRKRRLLEEQHDSSEKGDILSRFLEASKKSPDQMNDQYLRDIILNFIIAENDTAANTLSWFIYNLCKNPLVKEKIVQEVRQVIIGPNGEIDVDNIVEHITDETMDKMHYLHAALTET